jgi:hypothetical protein
MAFVKDPDADLDYGYFFGDWLQAGDSIASHDVDVITGDVVLGTTSHTTDTVTAWLSGGTVDTDATVRFRVSTTLGRDDDRTITLLIRER